MKQDEKKKHPWNTKKKNSKRPPSNMIVPASEKDIILRVAEAHKYRSSLKVELASVIIKE